MLQRSHSLLLILLATPTFLLYSCDQAASPKGANALGPETAATGKGIDPIAAVHRTLDPNDPLFGRDITDYGEFHNDILRAVDRQHKFSSDIPLSEKAYRGLMVDAVNEVLAAREWWGE